MSNVKLRFLCLIWPDISLSATRPIIEVEIEDPDRRVYFLCNAIKSEYHQRLHEFDASELVLWKCTIPLEILEDSSERLKNIRLDPNEPGESELLRLDSTSRISDYFKNGVPDQTLNILVQLFSGCDTYALSSMLIVFM